VDFLNLPENIRENANFMNLIEQARSLKADRSILRQSLANRLRILEMEEGQTNSEELQAAREEFQTADEALRETLVMMDALSDWKRLYHHAPSHSSSSRGSTVHWRQATILLAL
jgi:hypothetical protein